MIYISEVVKTWEEKSGWRIAPPGIAWIKEGYFIRVGDDCTLGDGCILGHNCVLGDNCILGDNCTLKGNCILGNGCTLRYNCILGYSCTLWYGCTLKRDCTLGDNCALGYGCTLEDECTLGSNCEIGSNATWVMDLGFSEGYRKTLFVSNGVIRVGAGCLPFPTVAEAIEHWKDRPDRPLARCLMIAAVEIAKINGWKIQE